ncbi:MAG: S8 family serine peptidase [Bdellovibrionia bacterium]
MKGLLGRASQVLAAGLLISSSHVLASAQPETVPGEYLVKLKPNLQLQQMQLKNLSQELGSYVKSTIPNQNIVVVKRPAIEIQSHAIKSLANNPLVDIVEPNYYYRFNKTPNDPMFGQLWGLKNNGQQDSQRRAGVAGVDIGAEQAWDITTGSSNIVVAVIDTGVNYNSPDLKPNMWTNTRELNGKAGVDDDGNGIVDDIYGAAFVGGQVSGNPLDDHGHGSHCAGTIGARGNDGVGVAGVAWNVKIMGVKFLSKDGGGSLEDAIKSIDYATSMGAKVLSNSWGGGGHSDLLKEAIERSNKAGTLFVAAAGNESNNNDANPTYPASYDVANVLSVAAVDNRGTMASFSNYGRNKVHVGAPGVNILSTTTSGFDSWSGTSMAAPHVSGIAVLLASTNPQMSGVEMKERITRTAVSIPGLRGKVKSGGIANAYTTLTNTQAPPDANDPANWKTVPYSLSSAHPYGDKINESYEITVAGANEISIFFERFDTERDYDKVAIYDRTGKLVDTISGRNDETFSAVIKGNYARLVFTSDDSVTRYGFDISKVAFR